MIPMAATSDLLGRLLAQQPGGPPEEDDDEDDEDEDVFPRAADIARRTCDSMSPSSSPPIMAPGMLPMPPMIVAVKALSP